MQTKSYDVVIVGGGMVGAALACMLAQKTTLSLAVLEAKPQSQVWNAAHYHHRVSAISLSSVRIFQALKVWREIEEKRVSPFRRIQVWDAACAGETVFDSREIAEPWLGFIIENVLIQTILEESARRSPQVNFISPVDLQSVSFHENQVVLASADGRTFCARLAVAADGANSWLRQQSGIETVKTSYHQRAVVADVRTELPHHQTARQVFRATGPLAFLPLIEENNCSIVWSLPDEEAALTMALDETEFVSALENAFEFRLGSVSAADRRFDFPLYRQHARQYVGHRLALVGDAAHTIHPLAGQGVNMGLLDAASLADMIADSEKSQRDFGEVPSLRRYERWRKADNLAMQAGVDMLKRLFASEQKSIQCARSFGLTAVNRARWIRNIFTRHAVGDREGLPTLAMGTPV